jgi:hypothetical protein
VKRLALTPLLVVLGLALAGCAGSGPRSSPVVPASVRTAALPVPAAQAELASKRFNITVTALPDSTAVPVSKKQAEDTALHHPVGSPRTPLGVTATLVSATDSDFAKVATDGTRTPLISDRTVWLVLIPGQRVPIIYPMGKSGPPFSYAATLADLVDANRGKLLLGAALTR